MNATLQPVLVCGQSDGTDMSVFTSGAGLTYEVYIGVALLERVEIGPKKLQHKMLVGRLYNAGVAVGRLQEAFGHEPRTIKRWGDALRSGDIEEMARVFGGRSARRKVTPELIKYAQQLYRERERFGKSFRAAIIQKVGEVFEVSISPTVASNIFRLERESSEAAQKTEDRAIDAQEETFLGTNKSPSVNQSPTLPPALCPDAPLVSEQLIHHAGQALFIHESKGFSDPLQRQFLGQILQGAVNVEQSKTLCGLSLSNFTGPFVSNLREQRNGLDAMASPDGVLDIYRLNAQLLADGPNRGDLYLFDPHTKEYTGQLKVMKGWCGRRHGIAKIINMDSFHTRSGRPCFVQHYSPYYDMRERFFMSLLLFNLLFEADKRRGRTFVIDRGIYGLSTLLAFALDYVITWEKGYASGGWIDGAPTVEFTRNRTKNNSADLKPVHFQCQESPWRRDPSFRRIVVRVSRQGTKDIEVSVITSHPDMDVQDVVWAIFRRWVQENDFKYLDTHFGFNQLTSRASASVAEKADTFEDRPVDCPEYKELKSTVGALETKLGRKLVLLRRRTSEADELRVRKAKSAAVRAVLLARLEKASARIRGEGARARRDKVLQRERAEYHAERGQIHKRLEVNAEKRRDLEAEIVGIEADIEPLEERLCNAVRKQSRLQLLIDGSYMLLDTRRKSCMDALRVTASNMFRNVQERFRVICDNFRDDHVMVRMLSRCSGSMTRADGEVLFKVWIPGTLQPHRVRAIQTLLKEIEEQTNSEFAGAKPMRLKLVIGPFEA